MMKNSWRLIWKLLLNFRALWRVDFKAIEASHCLRIENVHGLHFGVDAIPLGKHFSVEEDRQREAALVIGRLVQSGRDRVAQLFWREIG